MHGGVEFLRIDKPGCSCLGRGYDQRQEGRKQDCENDFKPHGYHSLGVYSERILYVAIEQKVIAGSREVLFQAATNRVQTFLNGTKASSRPGQPPRNASPTGKAFVPALPCLTSLGALTPPVGGVAALREHLPAPRMTPFLCRSLYLRSLNRKIFVGSIEGGHRSVNKHSTHPFLSRVRHCLKILSICSHLTTSSSHFEMHPLSKTKVAK